MRFLWIVAGSSVMSVTGVEMVYCRSYDSSNPFSHNCMLSYHDDGYQVLSRLLDPRSFLLVLADRAEPRRALLNIIYTQQRLLDHLGSYIFTLQLAEICSFVYLPLPLHLRRFLPVVEFITALAHGASGIV